MHNSWFGSFFRVYLAFTLGLHAVYGQLIADHQKPGRGNPLIPGYFADPTVRKIGDTYYVYATTDGNGWGAGPSQVWTSTDFVNWTIQPMNWPNTHWYWAPDMAKGYDGRYYLYYSQPVQLYGAVSNSPTGPWSPLQPEGEALIPNYKIPGVITLDGQTFQDDDGKIYMYWGTWGIYPDHGCAVGLLNPDMKTFADIKLIPNTDAKDFFEAPFVFKRKGVYYFMYSSGRCEDHTYRVQYAKSTAGPMGPFVYPEAHNPVLETNANGTVHGPGHHSILQEGDDYYMVYHRHNNPHSGGGFHRQLAVDKLEFDENGDIRKVVPTHTGVGFLGKNTIPYKNLARDAKVTASSEYGPDFRATFAVDDNNGTLWKAADNMNPAWLQLDLGAVQPVRTIHTQFEYATWYYQYRIEYSQDGKNWSVFSDRTGNRQWGSPMIDRGDVNARFLRISITDTQVPGLFRAIWNVKVFSEAGVGKAVLSPMQPAAPENKPEGLLIDFDAEKAPLGKVIDTISNGGSLAGNWIAEGNPYVTMLAGRQAIVFDGKTGFHSTFNVPTTLSGNSSHTVMAWVFNPDIQRHEPIFAWTRGTQDLTRGILGYGYDKGNGAVVRGAWPDVAYKTVPGAGQWHHVALTFDGYMERLYVDGVAVNTANKMLFLNAASVFTIGKANDEPVQFSGALSALNVYDRALTSEEVTADYRLHNDGGALVWFRLEDEPFGTVTALGNHGNFGGELRVKDGALACEPLHGRIAIVAKQQSTLQAEPLKRAFANGADATLTVEFLPTGSRSPLMKLNPMKHHLQEGRWNNLVLTRGSGQTTVFLNGKPVDVNPDDLKREFVDADLGLLHVTNMAIASIEAYLGNWQVQEVAAYTDARSAVTRGGLISQAVGFAIEPRFINAKNIFMRADTVAGVGIKYRFVDLDSNRWSDWQDEPHYLVTDGGDGARPSFQVIAKDLYGNVSDLGRPVAVGDLPAIVQLSAAPDRDYLREGVAGTVWDGLSGDRNRIDTVLSLDGKLSLSSSNTRWDGRDSSGPFVYKEIEGDFVIEAELVDISGLKERKGTPNEPGLMVRIADGGVRETFLQNSVMTGWGVGNLATFTDGRNRRQQNNGLGWGFHRHLQIQRVGSVYYLRSSADGLRWIDLPGSPYQPSVDTDRVQVGIYQVTNDDKPGYGQFGTIKLMN